MQQERRELTDVVGIGAVSVDFFGTTEEWPALGDKERLHSFSVHDGGLVGTALVAVARLGGRASCAGALGFSEMAERAVQALKNERVDTSLVLRTPGCEPCISFVISVTGGQRTIFSSQSGVSFPLPDCWTDVTWYRTAKVLLIDHVSGQAGIEAAKLARAHGVTVVIDAERRTETISEALAHSDHIVVPYAFASLYTGASSIEEMMGTLRKEEHQTVIITSGSRGCSGRTREGCFHIPSYPVDTVDTTGCGDVFHGAYALMVARGESVLESCRFASAAAALSATKVGGRVGIPTLEEVQRLLS